MLFGRPSMFLLDCIQCHRLCGLLGLQGRVSLGIKQPFLGKSLPWDLDRKGRCPCQRCQGKGAMWVSLRPSGA